jgi:hypothetical protein
MTEEAEEIKAAAARWLELEQMVSPHNMTAKRFAKILGYVLKIQKLQDDGAPIPMDQEYLIDVTKELLEQLGRNRILAESIAAKIAEDEANA